MIETHRLKNVVIFVQTTLSFVLSRKILNEIPLDQYKMLLNNNISKTYRKADSNAKQSIDKEAKEQKLEDKMECYAKRPVFITLKDHKENF